MSTENKQRKIEKSDAEWRQQLTAEQYQTTRLHGTEPPFSHPYNATKKPGTYRCVACGEPVFSSDHKFDSGTGWPSFNAPHNDEALSEYEDRKLFVTRTEVRCAACDSHLGHVFPDGPDPTGLRYCINGVALKHETEDE